MFIKVGEALQSIHLEPLDGSLEQAFLAQLENSVQTLDPAYASVEDAVADMKVRSGLVAYLQAKQSNALRNKVAFSENEKSFDDIIISFKKTAAELKKVAPKAKDFLYFSAVMMHAAEAAALNEDGTPKLRKDGKEVVVGWNTSNDSWKWETNDKSIQAFRNKNGDIFPESELIVAHKKWVGKPLCIDHKSSSVDHVRGFIVDTFYDSKLKRVIGLCALDRHNYPDLAHKVATGYSDSVSMGTGVARAVCYDCGKVARSAPEFCKHMKDKTCYGEINLDLNPIELSIVVNGADPKAHIKHIIASVQNLGQFVDSKSSELRKIASTYRATISSEDGNNNRNLSFESSSLEELKHEIEKAMEELGKIEKSVEEIGHNEVMNADDGNSGLPESNQGLAPPVARYASSSLEDLRAITSGIEAKLSEMKTSVDKLAHAIQEDSMSEINKKSYYQGTEEPTPGSPKYEVDKMNVDLRTKDRIVSSVVDTGPVDQLFPGDLEKKKLVARAEAEERALRRNAAVELAKKALNKEGYWLGTTEPTPGKPQYAPDKMNVDLRDKDKHMVGQKPFPGVGSVDGLHPSPDSADESDELKRKKLLSRAHSARFVKEIKADGSEDRRKSAWQVFFGDQLVLNASVDELTNGRGDFLYDSVATKPFGAKLMNKVKAEGADKVKAMFKTAQDQMPPAMPAAPAADSSAAPAPEMTSAPASADDGQAPKDPHAQAVEMAETIRDTGSDLVDKLQELSTDLADGATHLENEQAEMKAGDPAAMPPATASAEIRSLQTTREQLNRELISTMKSAVASIQNNLSELAMIADYNSKGMVRTASGPMFTTIAQDGMKDARKAIEDGSKIMASFVRYARGTESMLKRAHAEVKGFEMTDENSEFPGIPRFSRPLDENGEPILDHEVPDPLTPVYPDEDPTKADHEVSLEDAPTTDWEDEKSLLDLVEPGDDEDTYIEADEDEDTLHGDENDAVAVMGTPDEVKKMTTTANFDSRNGRAAMRAKLAGAATVKFSPMLDKFHPKGGVKTELDVAVSNNADVIENLEERHEKMLDVALKNPKARKEAQVIQSLIAEGKLAESDLDGLVAEGLDKDAVAYYRKYYSQVDGGSEFASELVKEHVKAGMEESLKTYEIKIARAYELTNDMIARGLVHNNKEAVASQVEDIMSLDDAGFRVFKKAVEANVILQKNAGHMPVVGVRDSFSDVVKVAAADDFVNDLSQLLSSSTRKMF